MIFNSFDNDLGYSRDLWDNSLWKIEKPVSTINVIATKEEKEKYIYAFEVPGASKDNLKISIDGKYIVFSYERNILDKKETIQQRFILPDSIGVDTIEAEIKDGILFLIIHNKHKTIEIKQLK